MRTIAAWMVVLSQAAFLASATGGETAAIYPSGASAPENLLRIEVRFSQPLRTPLQADQLRLLDQTGREIDGAFLDLVLPSADNRRVTILMHPGRVKSGVGANLALGRALHAGSAVTLVINHPALLHPLVKTWAVTASDTTPPCPGRWTFDLPRPRSRDALQIHLDKPLSSTAEELIAVRDGRGQRVRGRGRLDKGETVWRFSPSQPWRAGRYALLAHPDLEDAAGNRVCAAFELGGASEIRCDSSVVLPFEVKPRSPEADAKQSLQDSPRRPIALRPLRTRSRTSEPGA